MTWVWTRQPGSCHRPTKTHAALPAGLKTDVRGLQGQTPSAPPLKNLSAHNGQSFLATLPAERPLLLFQVTRPLHGAS